MVDRGQCVSDALRLLPQLVEDALDLPIDDRAMQTETRRGGRRLYDLTLVHRARR
jgi:hypothetical protein